MDLRITNSCVSRHPFRGIGTETDAFVFDETNRKCGVDDKDLELIERRFRAVQPAISRMFVDVAWFNPALDGRTFEWTNPYYGHLVRQLRLLDAIGARVNLVLFQPMPPAVKDLDSLVHGMIGLLERLRGKEGVKGLGWLTLYNEPDSMFPHESPLIRQLFDEKRLRTQPPFAEYVRINRLALALLRERGLSDIRLVVADTVWGHPLRLERIKRCAEAFADDDVVYSYHNYSAETPGFYTGNPNWAYPGVAEEARLFCEVLGPDRELMLWEFNGAAAGFGSHFLGIGPQGTDMISSLENAVTVTHKVMTVAGLGVTGCCLWCLHDMIYLGKVHVGPMFAGLWRFKWERWYPRPYYHYYALLCRSFRADSQVLRVEGVPSGVTALATRRKEGPLVLGLLNNTPDPVTVKVHWPKPGGLQRYRVYPAIVPNEGDLPVSEQKDCPVTDGGFSADLAREELTVVQSGQS